jgi:hypothetical protein
MLKKVRKKIEVLTQQGNTALTNPPDDQTKSQAEALIKKGKKNHCPRQTNQLQT